MWIQGIWFILRYCTVLRHKIQFYVLTTDQLYRFTNEYPCCILGGLWIMVLNATFNNISVISGQSVLLLEETRVPGENH
jgi:hypothetical protein